MNLYWWISYVNCLIIILICELHLFDVLCPYCTFGLTFYMNWGWKCKQYAMCMRACQLWRLEGLCDLDWDGGMVLLNKYNGMVWDLVIDWLNFKICPAKIFIDKLATLCSPVFLLSVPHPLLWYLYFCIKLIDGQNFGCHILASNQLLSLPTFWQINLVCPHFGLCRTNFGGQSIRLSVKGNIRASPVIAPKSRPLLSEYYFLSRCSLYFLRSSFLRSTLAGTPNLSPYFFPSILRYYIYPSSLTITI